MPKFILSLLLALLAFPFISSAQTNCTVSNVHFDEPAPGAPVIYSLKISAPTGCASSLNNQVSTTGSYTCPGGARYYDTEVKTESDGVVFKAKCSVYPYQIQTSDHFITIKFLPNTPGYYCNRSNPLMPKCEYRTTGTGNTTQAICSANCKVDSNYFATISHHKVGQTEQKRVYEIGDKIEFVASTNIGGTNNRYVWNFGDAMNNSSTLTSYSPVVYSFPGIKKVDLKVTNATGQTYIATSTEVKVKCTPPTTNTFDNVATLLQNYSLAKIPADNFFKWSIDYQQDISRVMSSYQCSYMSADKIELAATTQAILWSKSITDARQPSILNIQQLVPPSEGNLPGGHSIIPLKVTDTTDQFESRYNIKFLDPNGPIVMDMDCKVSKKDVWGHGSATSTSIQPTRSMFCLHPTLGFVIPYTRNLDKQLVGNLRTSLLNICNFSSTKFCSERRNLSNWLETHYPIIDNSDPVFAPGICRGWSEFVLRVAYLGDFLGECKTLPTSAAVGLTDLSEMLLKLREFLSGQLPLLGR